MIRDPQEPRERLARFRADDQDEAWLQALNDGLARIALPERAASSQLARALPAIYIVGAPRSGSTLLSQLLSRHLAVGYINNLIARFWARPSVGIRLSQLLLGEQGRDLVTFESGHGSTSGVAGPHEFGYFWRHWLQLDRQTTHHLDATAQRQLDREGLGRALEHEILATFGAPVVFKNLICGFHAAMLTELHPQSLFVHISRDRAATCASILSARAARYGSYDAWWSLTPSTGADLKKLASPCEQVVRQVQDISGEVSAELARPGVTSVSITYESLCRNPGAIVQLVAGAAGALGTPVAVLPGIPEHFAASPGPQLPDDLRNELGGILAKAEGTR